MVREFSIGRGFRRTALAALVGLLLAVPAPAQAAVSASKTADHGGGAVAITQTDATVTIGNDYLTRTFSKADGTWKTTELNNKRINKKLAPAAGSEDFVVNLVTDDLGEGTPAVNPTSKLDRTGWQATLTNASGTAFTQAGNLFDGNLNTYVDEYNTHGYPVSLVIDLGSTQTVGSFSYNKRPGYTDAAYGINGTMGGYKLFVSDDGQTWTAAGEGAFTRADYNLHQEGSLFNVGDTVYGNLDQPRTARYVKIQQTSDALGSTEEFTGAEVNLFSDQFKPAVKPASAIKASDLTLARVTVDDAKNIVRAEFNPVEVGGVTWQIAQITAMEDGAHYMNSHLEIKASDPAKVRIDYIELDRFALPAGVEGLWSIPDLNDVSSMWIGKHELMLGQPIYANGMFFGSEFPAEDTDVKGDAMQIRYYSGKTIAKMAADGESVIADGTTFRTWSNVVGAAQGTDTAVVQTDFFSYIDDIATPTDFRKQYNSWYDNMLGISPASVKKSFLGSEKGLAQNGVEPLDSYVVDDGWNNYNSDADPDTAVNPNDSGTTNNQTGFWEFNSKWPNELYDSTSLAHNLQSSFGIWVGPQGGYNYFGKFAQFLANSGTGEVQTDHWKCIDTGSRTYIKNFQDRFLDYQSRFDIDYWKWDGFALRPCTNASHNHMTGGDNNMYYTSDMWEAWTDLFETFRAERAKEGKGLWINATCYVNLSPWMLQWVNTIWVQDSGDTGEAQNANAARHQQKIYYRDHVYSNLYQRNQVQFPLKNIYNHDPIYGVSDASNATTEVFREYLMDNAMRGTAFWELYFSPSIMDEEKWMVVADVLDFAESNYDVLQNAKLFTADGAFTGDNPASEVKGVYGYSAWEGDRGIVSFVNPTASEQTYSLKLTDVVGVPKGVANLKTAQVYPYAAGITGDTYSYGDTVTVTLPAHSSKILQFGNAPANAVKPAIVSAKQTAEADGQATVRVRFSTRMGDKASFKLDGKAVAAKLLDDYRTYELTVTGTAAGKDLSIAGIKSAYDVAAADQTVKVSTAGDVATVEKAEDAKDAVSVAYKTEATDKLMLAVSGKTGQIAKAGIAGTGDFSVRLGVNTKATGATVLAQGDAQATGWQLGIDADGYAVFTVGGLSVTSKHDVTTVTKKATGTFNTDAYQPTETATATAGKVNDGKTHALAAVRELNGMVKLYVDGELVNSAYDGGKKADLAGSPVTLGSAELTGFVADVHVANAASYYDDASKQAEDLAVGATVKGLPQTGWKATACSEATSTPGTGGDGAAMDTVDGNPRTYWHSNYTGQDTHEGKHWLKVDFGGDLTFDNLVYTGRPGGGNGDWTAVRIVGIKAGGTETEIRADGPVTMDGNRQVTFSFETSQTFRAVRFEITGQGGFASAAEISASTNIKQVDGTKVEEAKAKAAELAPQVDPTLFSRETYPAFEQALAAVNALNPFDADDAAMAASLLNQLNEAYKNLVPVTPAAVEAKGSSLRYSADAASALDGMRFGYTFKLPEGAELVKKKSGWYYGLTESTDKGPRDITSMTELDGTFTANLVFTNIPKANYGTDIYARFKVTYELNGAERTVETKVRHDNVNAVAQRIVDSKTSAEAEKGLAREILGIKK